MRNYFRTPALSEAKSAEILVEIQKIAPQVEQIRTEWVYYIEADGLLAPVAEQRLDWLLAETFQPRQYDQHSFLRSDEPAIEIGPRLGLVTPWSSNTQVILTACDVQGVARVELFRRYGFEIPDGQILTSVELSQIALLLHDRMTESVYQNPPQSFELGSVANPVQQIPILEEGLGALRRFGEDFGLKFSPEMEQYITDYFVGKQHRNPTDVELFMFGQLNSQHCRHHTFNGLYEIDGVQQPQTMMEMIRATVTANPGNARVALRDNAAVLEPQLVKAFLASNPATVSPFQDHKVRRGIAFKVETHNHPSTVSPYPGAATGVAVRRDIFGLGRGAVPVGHLACYYVGNLCLPGCELPWEREYVKPSRRFASPLQIIIEASNGASDNANCFGNPVILGATRSFEQMIGSVHYGYRKTVMVAGSFGYIDERHIEKQAPQAGMLIVQIGGAAFPIGFGGASGSSVGAGAQGEILDFDSVQRAAPFVERCNFDVLRACSELGDDNPIATLTDLGAGGDSVAAPELVFPAGARIEIRKIPCGDKTMSVLVFWCNESQERMLVLLWPDKLALFQRICERNRCATAVIGEVTGDGQFVVTDQTAVPQAPREQRVPIDVGMDWLLADLPQQRIKCQTVARRLVPLKIPDFPLRQHLERVLRLLDVGSKEFLTRKADRYVGNRSARQQEVGPLQLPLANCAVVADGPFDRTGMVTAIGEQPIVGLVNNEAGVRMSIGEALTNVVWAQVSDIEELNFSATWQWPCGQPGEDARLYQAVKTATACCQETGLRISVGKDSLSMTLKEAELDGTPHLIRAPGTVQMAVFGPCADIRKTVTPDIKLPGKTKLMFIDLAPGRQRLGGSALARVYNQIGDEAPDLESTERLMKVFSAVQECIRQDLILAGHDRSDGGLITAVLEMAFAGNCGLQVKLRGKRLRCTDPMKLLFNQELALFIEFLPEHYLAIYGILRGHGLTGCAHVIGQAVPGEEIEIRYDGRCLLEASMPELRAIWRETSFRLDERQTLPELVAEERQKTYRRSGPKYVLPFEPKPTPRAFLVRKTKPRVAILREAGTNGDRDMAESFYMAGFEAVDVHATDLVAGRITLREFKGIGKPGGFSFGDVLDAGKGEAGVFRFHPKLASELVEFCARKDTFMLGICNGCQFMALMGLVPWENIPTQELPRFIRNRAERFQSRFVTVKILPSNSIFLRGMEGAILGIPVAHGEGRFVCPDPLVMGETLLGDLAPIRYVDDEGAITESYPMNPNGSPLGIAGLSSQDGRFLAVMPHCERLPTTWLWPWQPREWRGLQASPWLRVFQNALLWCENS